MVAVSRVNSCRGCTFVHERWAGRAGVTADDLQAIDLGDLEDLDKRSRAAVADAAALAEARFREPIAADLTACAGDQLTPDELAAVDAVARAMAFANLSANTLEVATWPAPGFPGVGQGSTRRSTAPKEKRELTPPFLAERERRELTRPASLLA